MRRKMADPINPWRKTFSNWWCYTQTSAQAFIHEEMSGLRRSQASRPCPAGGLEPLQRLAHPLCWLLRDGFELATCWFPCQLSAWLPAHFVGLLLLFAWPTLKDVCEPLTLRTVVLVPILRPCRTAGCTVRTLVFHTRTFRMFNEVWFAKTH